MCLNRWLKFPGAAIGLRDRLIERLTMPICFCAVCSATATKKYEDSGRHRPGVDLPAGKYKQHQLSEAKRRAQTLQRSKEAAEQVAADIVLTTMQSRPPSSMPIRNRDVLEEPLGRATGSTSSRMNVSEVRSYVYNI